MTTDFSNDTLFLSSVLCRKAPVCAAVHRVSAAELSGTCLWMIDQSITYYLKCILSFSGGISSSVVRWTYM